MIKKIFLLCLIIASSFSYALDVNYFEKIVIRAEKVKTLSGVKKQAEAIDIIKTGFKTVQNHEKDIPGNQAGTLKARLRVIYKDVKNNQYESFNEALSEGKNYLIVYKTTSEIFK